MEPRGGSFAHSVCGGDLSRLVDRVQLYEDIAKYRPELVFVWTPKNLRKAEVFKEVVDTCFSIQLGNQMHAAAVNQSWQKQVEDPRIATS